MNDVRLNRAYTFLYLLFLFLVKHLRIRKPAIPRKINIKLAHGIRIHLDAFFAEGVCLSRCASGTTALH